MLMYLFFLLVNALAFVLVDEPVFVFFDVGLIWYLSRHALV